MRWLLNRRNGGPSARLAARERELLVACARTHMDPARASRVRALAAEGIDWEALLRAARPHGLVPLLHHHLRGVSPDGVPPAILDRTQEIAAGIARRNARLAADLVTLCQALRVAGIPVVAYKGPTLAVAAYDALELREFIDLDVIVPREDVRRAKQVLIRLGYEPTPFSEVQERLLLRYQGEWSFVRRAHDGVVDLHWEIAPRFLSRSIAYDLSAVTLEQVLLGSTFVPALSREDLVLALAIHGARHAWIKLGWICDVAELLSRAPTIDWTRLTDRARALGAERMLQLGLLVAANVLGATVPPAVQAAAEGSSTVAALASLVAERLFDETGHADIGFPARMFLPFQLALRPGWQGKVRHLSRVLTSLTEADLLEADLPPRMSFLYYGIRPLRLLNAYVGYGASGTGLARSASWGTGPRWDGSRSDR